MRRFWIMAFLTPCLLVCAKPKSWASDHGYRIIREFAEAKKRELGCSECRVDGYFPDNLVSRLDLDLLFRKELSVAEARELYVNLLLDFVDTVAADQSIRLHLVHRPPIASEVDLSLAFIQKEGWKPTPIGTVALMAMGKGNILYFRTHDDKTGYQDLHAEPLFVAIETVQKAGKLKDYPWLEKWLAQEKELLKTGSSILN